LKKENPMLVNYYYDLTDAHLVSDDADGDLVALCAHCAADARIRPLVQFASRGDDATICGLCDLDNGAEMHTEAQQVAHIHCREAMIDYIWSTHQ
jgi:hypothetical protein